MLGDFARDFAIAHQQQMIAQDAASAQKRPNAAMQFTPDHGKYNAEEPDIEEKAARIYRFARRILQQEFLCAAGQQCAQGDDADHVAQLLNAAEGAFQVIKLGEIKHDDDGDGMHDNCRQVSIKRRLFFGTGEKRQYFRALRSRR